MTLDRIKDHWERAGRQLPSCRLSPTSRDPYLGQLEEDNILAFLPGRRRVLEIGCGDGSHTAKYAKSVERLLAIDLAQSLIDLARARLEAEGVTNVTCAVASAVDLGSLPGAGAFDCVISQRCLINLPDWPRQQETIAQIHASLQAGGLFILTEGFQDGLIALNRARRRCGLKEIEVVEYNRNLMRAEFEACVREQFDIVAIRDYGTYLFLSRVLHPLAVLPDEPKHDARLNQASMELARRHPIPELRDYSYNLFYVLRTK